MTLSRPTIGFIGVACAAIIGYMALSGIAQAFFHNAIGTAAVLAVLVGVRIHRPASSTVWYVVAFGLALLVAGDLAANIASLSSSEYGFPSISDVFYLSGNLSIIIASVMIIRARSRYRDLGSFIDATIVATSAAFLAWKFFMEPYATDPSLTTLQKAVSLAYPVMSTLLFVVAARLLFTRGRRSPSFWFMLAAMGSSLVGDVVFTELLLLGAYYPGHPIDLAYVLWFIFWAAAALHPSMITVTSGSDTPVLRTSNRRMLFLVAAILLVPATTIILWTRDDSVSAPVFVGFSSILFLLVFWRMRSSVQLSETAFAERELVLERERVLHDVASGLAVATTRDEAFDAVTTSLRSIAVGNVSAQIVLINDDVGTVVSICENSDPRLRRRVFHIIPSGDTVASGKPVHDASTRIVSSLKHQMDRDNPWAFHEMHMVNPKDEQPIVLVLAAQWGAPVETADLLKGIGVQLLQALERISLVDDINERKNQALFHSLVRNSSDVTIIVEVDGTIRYVSPAAHSALGFSPDDLVGTRLHEFVHPDDISAFDAFMNYVSHNPGHARKTEFRLKNMQSTWHDVEAVANNLTDDPDVGGIVLNVHDITVRKRGEAMLEHQAFHDALTSLPNRALFLDRLVQTMKQAANHGERIPILFIDLDRFKFINDSLGHDGGDALLIMASQRIQRCVAEDDTVARLGGDEFTAILNSPESASRPYEIAESLIQSFHDPFFVKDRELVVTASIGVAWSAPNHEHGEDLLREADIAMYQAKSRGRNSVVMFDAEMGLSLEKRVQLEQDLGRALENKEFELHYQPEIDLASGKIVWLEALIRWNHPERGLLYPDEFIPLAEESGLILPLGHWVVHEACRQTREWKDRLPDHPFGVSINLSARQLLDPRLIGEVRLALQSHELEASSLRAEITETILMREMEQSLNTLSTLRAIGVQLAIDDFGHGYSSLAYLRYFPINVLKLDRSFLIESDRPDQDDAIIQAVTTLAHSLDVKVTVEGIETPDQLMRVNSLACDQGQGFLFAQAHPATDVPALFERNLLSHHVDQSLAIVP